MTTEKVYHIPQKLNADPSYLGGYSLGDLMVFMMLFPGCMVLGVMLKVPYIIAVPATYAVVRFRFKGYTLWHWAAIATRFLFGKSSNSYILFERSLRNHGND